MIVGLQEKKKAKPRKGFSCSFSETFGRYYLLISVVSFCAILSSEKSWSQGISNRRSVNVIILSDTLKLDSLSIVPNSEFIRSKGNVHIDTSYYDIDYANSLIIWKNSYLDKGFQVSISYKVLPYSLSSPLMHKDFQYVSPERISISNPFVYTYKKATDDIFALGGINKSGSISRGITFGNSQDVIVNSSLDLRLSGRISENVSILAAITDENIPIQPEGNTQQIQEFDKVFIKLHNDNTSLIAGDFELASPKGYFMKFYKKAQGASFSTILDRKVEGQEGPNEISIIASAALSIGKFARNVSNGTKFNNIEQEGNQGPYKLAGNNNEIFIIVISGTEKIYVDGVKLVRGQDNDYVIDYNTAEVTFTPKLLITKDKRIIIEFQYSDRNYSRSLIYGGAGIRKKKLAMHLAIYSEQDSKNQPIDQDLTDEQKQLMHDIGDNIDAAISSRIDSVGYTEDGVLYIKKDTLIKNDTLVYYEYSGDSGVYRVSFSLVGQGNGNYVLDANSIANGRVFTWVQPDGNGNPQGNYEPIVLLVTPKKRQMAALSGSYQFSKTSKVTFELAVSNNDINTISSLDKANDDGYGFKVNFYNDFPLSKTKKNPWVFGTNFNYEQIDRHFTPIERYRTVEFERDWNTKSLQFNSNQYIPGLALKLSKKKVGFFQYQFKSYLRDTDYQGFRNFGKVNYHKNGFKLIFDGSYLTSKTLTQNNEFLRLRGLLSKQFNWLVIGIKEDVEHNVFKNSMSDTLQVRSYQYYDIGVFVKSSDTAKNTFELSFNQRIDLLPLGENFITATTGDNVKFAFALQKNPNSRFNGSVTYRGLKINDGNSSRKPDESLLGRIEYRLRLWKGAITSSTFYEVGSGLESKKDFTFIKVAEGQGIWEWIDRDSNNIESKDEFEQAIFQYNANYIKVYIPTNDYIKTYSNMFNESINIRPAVVWRSKEGIKKFIAKFSNQTAYRITQKSQNSDIGKSLNPFYSETSDSNLVTLNSSFRSILYFNRTDPKFGADVKYQLIKTKSLLVNGLDSRTQLLSSAHLRWNITRQFTLDGFYTSGEKSYASYLDWRDYRIIYQEAEPKITYQPGTSFRIAILYNYKDKLNKLEVLDTDLNGDILHSSGNERAIHHKIGMEVRQNTVSKGSLTLNFNYISITYSNDSTNTLSQNTSIAFEMLEGLKTGSNITWSLSYQRNLSKNMQLSLTYDGRKSEETPAVHRGGVQLRAFF